MSVRASPELRSFSRLSGVVRSSVLCLSSAIVAIKLGGGPFTKLEIIYEKFQDSFGSGDLPLEQQSHCGKSEEFRAVILGHQDTLRVLSFFEKQGYSSTTGKTNPLE